MSDKARLKPPICSTYVVTIPIERQGVVASVIECCQHWCGNMLSLIAVVLVPLRKFFPLMTEEDIFSAMIVSPTLNEAKTFPTKMF
jgi:hypothetical protein